jgi:hypothetical protein
MLVAMTRTSWRSNRGAVRRTAAVSLVALLLGAAACTGDEAETPEAATSAAPSGPETADAPRLDRPEATWKVSIEQLRGGVDKSRRPAIAGGVQRSLQRWVAGAYRGEYPRHDFSTGFNGWTADAKRLARADREITTNAAIGSDLVQVVADQLQARLYVFAADGVAGGATAKVHLRFTGVRSNGALVGITVHGDVALTRDQARWRIFGYDLDRMVQAR